MLRPVGVRKGATAFSKAPHLACSTDGRPMSLLQHCAWHCFSDLPLPPLREIARLYGVSGVESPTVHAHCLALVRRFLPTVGENDLTNIMSRRLFDQSFAHALRVPRRGRLLW